MSYPGSQNNNYNNTYNAPQYPSSQNNYQQPLLATYPYSGYPQEQSIQATGYTESSDQNGDRRKKFKCCLLVCVVIGLVILGVSLFVALSSSHPDQFGFRISGASTCAGVGDVNGDGFNDILVGASSAGRVYIIFGRNSSFPAPFDVHQDLPGNGVELFVETTSSGDISADAGFDIRDAGDVNGDQLMDIIIGAPGASGQERGNQNITLGAGRTYVVFGKISFPAQINLDTLDGSNGFIINGIYGGQSSGFSVAGIGDIDGDSNDEIVVIAPGYYLSNQNVTYSNRTFSEPVPSGAAFIIFGHRGQYPNVLYLDNATFLGEWGITLAGLNDKELFVSASRLGDVSGDGIPDFILGSITIDRNATAQSDIDGRAFIIFGRKARSDFETFINVSTISGAQGFVYGSSWTGNRPVSFVNDFNGDSINDILIGQAQDVSLILGRDASVNPFPDVVYSWEVKSVGGLSIVGPVHPLPFHHTLSNAGDVNGDGYADIVLGYAQANNAAGKTFVLFGYPGPFPDDTFFYIDITAVNGTNGFALNGRDGANINFDDFYWGDFSGSTVSAAGDVNGDSIEDFLVGATGSGPWYQNELKPEGEVYVVFGRNTTSNSFPSSLNIKDLD